jgi:hypothetical protein
MGFSSALGTLRAVFGSASSCAHVLDARGPGNCILELYLVGGGMSFPELGVVVHSYNPSTQTTEVRGSRVWEQPGPYCDLVIPCPLQVHIQFSWPTGEWQVCWDLLSSCDVEPWRGQGQLTWDWVPDLPLTMNFLTLLNLSFLIWATGIKHPLCRG